MSKHSKIRLLEVVNREKNSYRVIIVSLFLNRRRVNEPDFREKRTVADRKSEH